MRNGRNSYYSDASTKKLGPANHRKGQQRTLATSRNVVPIIIEKAPIIAETQEKNE
jgi:hypothetical protein